ncbi:MAG: NADH-quinone oxidoreductase subunit A [Candidatus Hodarchaeota archaeon]
MGIREKYPLPSEEDYKFATESKQGSKLLKIVATIAVLGFVIGTMSIVATLFLTPGSEPLYSVEGLSDVYKNYLPLVLWIFFGCCVFFGALIINLILMPWPFLSRNKKPADWQGTVPIECGETETKGAGMVQFGFQYYPYALIYVVFDVAGVFLMLWALLFGEFHAIPDLYIYFAAIILFLLGPLAAFAYWLKKGKIRWS